MVEVTMRIGELAGRTGVSRRLLRYYEEQGLITPQRSGNGYREYDDRVVDRVLQVRGLLDAGMSTRLIGQILPCLQEPGVLVCPTEASPAFVRALTEERDRMTARAEHLLRNRDAIDRYLDGLPVGAAPSPVRPSRTSAG